MITPSPRSSFLFLTGATGFLGHVLLAELLKRGRRCVVLLRLPSDRSRARLRELLCDLQLDLDELIAEERIILTFGDLADSLPPRPEVAIDAIIHAAGSTRFSVNDADEPYRTNCTGTNNLLEWATEHSIDEFHFVSTAYVCGKQGGVIRESISDPAPTFHNDYERSKWRAEHRCAEWSRTGENRLTMYRPSVIVGDSKDGRATAFQGLYLMLRAANMLQRMADQKAANDRRNRPLRIKARPDGRMNLVTVDYVASMVAGLVTDPDPHRGIYHLVHPEPPTIDFIRRAIESYFDIPAAQFIDPSLSVEHESSDYERVFNKAIASVKPYLLDTPDFERAHTGRAERRMGIECPRIDEVLLHRLARYAQSVDWGRKPSVRQQQDEHCRNYFEHFLPERLPRSQVARVHGLTTTVRFIIDDVVNGQWVCRFEDGLLEEVHRGSNGLREDFAYRTNRHHFRQAVSGNMDPQDIFLGGHADVLGDTEKALKMAMILHAFSREFPYRCDQPSSPSGEDTR